MSADIDLSKEKIWIALMKAGALTGCHQLSERSFSCRNYQFPLCARCTGILAGQLAALFSYTLYSGFALINIAASAAVSIFILGVDGIGQLKGSWVSNNRRRLITGLLCGFFSSALFFRLLTFGLKQFFNFIP